MLPSISVAARNSALSKAQVKEVLNELTLFHPSLTFETIYVRTMGDQDKKKSLRLLDKTDFFTREIDQMQQNGLCRIAIHSAKDLPDPLPRGLVLAALTKGVDPSDSLVLEEKKTLATLPYGARIATSSDRREASVRKLRDDFHFVDIRGTIEERLAKLDNREIEGLVVAQAALIRLNLTHLNYITLPGQTAPLQGQLAVIARENDKEMLELFRCLNQKKCSI
ncbi:MAG: hydroxymethylbilane synthase [Chlamydiales bacterium]